MEPQVETTSLLVVDDEPSNLESLEKIFQREGMRVLLANNAKEALEMVKQHRVHVVLTDLMMPGTTGIELLRALREISSDAEVVLMTAFGTVEAAVSAMREGAYDFVEKPLKRVHILKSVKKAAERQRLVAENKSLRNEINALTRREMIGHAPVLRHVIDKAAQAASSMASVLILGESGTGKELIARYVHEQSARARGPFVAVNCAALPEGILESELFGHEKGAFTGAIAKKDGRFAKAAGGTLFLDEIGELSPSVQVKLLRVLQEGEYEPVGGNTQKSDVRIVTATNRDLMHEVQSERFRADLYYRLAVVTLTTPPLRSRREDIPLLVDHFLGKFAAKNQRARLRIADDALLQLTKHTWPGNVRELENTLESLVVLTRGETIQLSDLPEAVRGATLQPKSEMRFSVGTTTLSDIELEVIRETLRLTKGDKALAAQLLGISTRTIYRRLDGDAGES
ncbi:MAG: sigma-54-dependent Fis family transcriptional regulator [Polyangiaceae bacterium]|nr:sigma-54-dependent Fis family transcriptional regulator [Polyangiaceae bacterium]